MGDCSVDSYKICILQCLPLVVDPLKYDRRGHGLPIIHIVGMDLYTN